VSKTTVSKTTVSKTAVTPSELTPPVGPFSHAIEVGGFLYFSRQVGQEPATGKVVEGAFWRDRACLPESLGGSHAGWRGFPSLSGSPQCNHREGFRK
jgi:hypothetical protein